MKYNSLFLICILVLISNTSMATPKKTKMLEGTSKTVDLLWKARGLQAMERLQELTKKSGDSQGKNLTSAEKCEWQLESAYAPFGVPSASGIVLQRTETIAHYFLAFQSGDKSVITQVAIQYFPDEKIPAQFTVYDVAKDWSVSAIRPSTLVVRSKECLFVFELENPLNGESAVRTQ